VLTVVAARSPDGSDGYLFVAGKKVGGAVVRNRVKRRLRALMRALGPDLSPGWWIALIAKPETVAARYDILAARVKDGLSRLGVFAEPAKPPEA
jgi:ribonuclease P protein component